MWLKRVIPGLFTLLLLFPVAAFSASTDTNGVPPKDATLVYVGTFTDSPAKSKGIYYYWLKTEGNEVSQNITLVPLGLAAETPSPAYLTLDLKRRLLFCVNETNSSDGKTGGAVSAFSIEPETGKLKFINAQPSGGTRPCHLVLDKAGKNLIVANYSSGSTAVFPVANDGRIGAATCVVQDTGKSVNTNRQTGPHMHGIALSPDNRFAFVCDLGIDKIMSYKFDADHGKLTPNDPPSVSITPGSGPRHIVFRPDGKFAYAINELASTVTAFSYDSQAGALKEIQTVSSLPGYFDGTNTAAEIGVVPSGHFLFASNRGNETVVLFEIDQDTGMLNWVEEQNTGGKTPRQFGIQPSGKHMVICNEDSNTLLVCRIDKDNGRLKPWGVFADAPSPVCAVFLPPIGGEKEKAAKGD